MKLLLVDDNPDDLFLTRRELAGVGHEVITCRNGKEALETFKRERPDLVLTDIFMSGMDGFELTEAIQKAAAPRWQPVVFLSGRRDDATQVRALEVGADAYIIKPVTAQVLDAKLRSIERLITLQRHAEERTHALERYHAIEEEEKRIARQLIERLVSSAKLDDPALQHWVKSATGFSGDVVAAARTPANVLHVMLADGTGHGLAAAINVLPIAPPFYSMTEKGFGIDSIVRELNAKVRQFLPRERFVAATLAAFDFREGVIHLWNGGNPEPFLMDAAGYTIHTFKTAFVPLGIMDDDEFNATLEAVSFNDGVQFVAFSDGLLEAGSTASRPFGFADISKVLRAAAVQERMSALKQAVASHVGNHVAHDDISLVLVDCRREISSTAQDSGASSNLLQAGTSDERAAIESGAAARHPSNWSFSLRLGATELRQLDVVPVLLNLANQFEDTRSLGGELFVVLSEFFNNALDHGLLRLDSRLKLSVDGMSDYLDQRSQRLKELSEGWIEIRLELLPSHSGAALLDIRCRDSGPGFDHKAREAAASVGACADESAAAPSELPFGRGLVLARSLCQDMYFNEAGNAVVATLCLAHRSYNV